MPQMMGNTTFRNTRSVKARCRDPHPNAPFSRFQHNLDQMYDALVTVEKQTVPGCHGTECGTIVTDCVVFVGGDSGSGLSRLLLERWSADDEKKQFHQMGLCAGRDVCRWAVQSCAHHHSVQHTPM